MYKNIASMYVEIFPTYLVPTIKLELDSHHSSFFRELEFLEIKAPRLAVPGSHFSSPS
jgi:hypothetical protein